MLKNYLKIAFRVFQRDRVYALINLLGLSSGLAISLLILVYVHFESSYESYNPNAERVARLTVDILNGETLIEQDCETFPPIGKRVKESIPEVEEFARAYLLEEKVIRIGDEHFRESRIYGADPSFLDVMHYPLVYGSQKHIFENPHEAILTESTAQKYYGKSNVLGKTFYMPAVDKEFIVTGVIKDSPSNTHLKFDMLISYHTMNTTFGDNDNNWSGNNTFTYVLLNEASSLPVLAEKLVGLNAELKEEKKMRSERIISQGIEDIHLYSNKSFEPEVNGDATSTYYLFGVAILVLLLAIINYINLATAKSLDRAKEVGIRKVIGSSLSQLRIQFFTESGLINLLGGILALFFMLLFMERFKETANLPATFSFFDEALFWVAIVFILLISTLLSGIFPALILSSMKPIHVLKGKYTQSGSGLFMRKSLVVFQFAITLFLLTQTLTANRQIDFLRGIDLGVDIESAISVRAPQSEKAQNMYAEFKDELLNNTEFKSAALSNSLPGRPVHELSTTTGVTLVGGDKDQNFNFYIYYIDHDFINTMDIELLSGKEFIDGINYENSVIVNVEAMKLWGLYDVEEAIGRQLNYWGRNFNIIGVVDNFHNASAKSPYLPMIFKYEGEFSEFVTIKLNKGDKREQVALARNIYEDFFPNSPFEFFFIDEEFDKQFKADEQFKDVFSTLTVFAILIACMGLFGLASFSIAKRTKEIGIRKVLGASVNQIITLISKDFVILVSIGIVIATPLTYLLINTWLDRYSNRIDLSFTLFALPIIGLFLISILTVIFKTLKISHQNPIESLRDE